MDLIKTVEIPNTLFSQLTDKNLERMRSRSKFGQVGSEKEMEKVARDFESVFVNKLFESMRKGVPKSGLLDSSAMKMYQSMMDQEMAKLMSVRKGMGIGAMVYKDLSQIDKVSKGENSFYSKIPMAPNTRNTLGE